LETSGLLHNGSNTAHTTRHNFEEALGIASVDQIYRITSIPLERTEVTDFLQKHGFNADGVQALLENTKVIKGARSKDNLKDADPIVEDNELEPVTISVEHVGIAKVSGNPQIKTMTGGLHNVTLDSLKALELTPEQVAVDGGYTFMLPKQVRLFTPPDFGKPAWLEPMEEATPETEITS
jgi:hypothetical protein